MDKTNENLVSDLNPAISKYVKIRSYIARKEAELKAELKPLSEAKEKLRAFLSAALIQNRIKNIGGESGTVFNSDLVQYKVVDPKAYLNWLIDNNMWETAKVEPIASETDAHAYRSLNEWLERNGEGEPEETAEFKHFLPPGVTRSVTVVLKVKAKGS